MKASQSSRYRVLANINQYQQGFTLLELLVVLVIIAIISTTSIGAIRFFGDDSSKELQKKVKSLLLLGVDEAILTGKVHGLFVVEGQLSLRKYARSSGEGKKKSAAKEAVGSVLSGLITLGSNSDKDKESAQPSSATQSVFSDPGAFINDGSGSWIELPIHSVPFPTGLEVNAVNNQSIDIDFGEKEKEKKQEKKSSLLPKKGDDEDDKDTEEEEKDQGELITIFWPSGLIYPEGEISIDDTNAGTTLEVRWLSTAQITLTGGPGQ